MAIYKIGSGYWSDMSMIDFSVLFSGIAVAETKKRYVLQLADGWVDFRGEGFKYNNNGSPKAGSVEGYAAYDDTRNLAISFGGFDVTVKAFVKAASTISTADDQRLIREMLSGKDTIIGNSLQDGLMGGAGNDILYGAGGADGFLGGAGRDRFVYRDVSESTVSEADLILDFSKGDKIDLSFIAEFAFVGTNAFSGAKAEVSFATSNGRTYVNADADGDGVADLSIGVNSVFAFTATDFIL